MRGDERLQGCSVLVLEDHYVIAEELKRVLVNAGASVIGPFSDAALAVAAADRHKPSCALVDINLGESATFVPAKALLARAVPVAFVTGYGEEAIPPELSETPHIQKPASSDQIIATVDRLCPRQGRQQSG